MIARKAAPALVKGGGGGGGREGGGGEGRRAGREEFVLRAKLFGEPGACLRKEKDAIKHRQRQSISLELISVAWWGKFALVSLCFVGWEGRRRQIGSFACFSKRGEEEPVVQKPTRKTVAPGLITLWLRAP